MKMPNKTLPQVNVNLLTSLGWHCSVQYTVFLNMVSLSAMMNYCKERQ